MQINIAELRKQIKMMIHAPEYGTQISTTGLYLFDWSISSLIRSILSQMDGSV